jgi:hypothetical protein
MVKSRLGPIVDRLESRRDSCDWEEKRWLIDTPRGRLATATIRCANTGGARRQQRKNRACSSTSDPASKPDRQSKHYLLTTPRITKLPVIFSWLVRLRHCI